MKNLHLSFAEKRSREADREGERERESGRSKIVRYQLELTLLASSVILAAVAGCLPSAKRSGCLEHCDSRLLEARDVRARV